MIYLKQRHGKGENCKYVLGGILLLSFVIIFALSACASTNQSTDAPIHIQNEISPSPSPSPSPSHPPSPSSSPLDDESQEINIDMVYSPMSVDTVYSSDGRYFVEGYGVNLSITTSGVHPVEEIRIVEVDSEETVWNMSPGYHVREFIWSPNDRYVSITYAGRIRADALIVDILTMSEQELPGMDELAPMFPDGTPKDIRADPSIKPQYWLDDCRIRVAFSWYSDVIVGGRVSGTYMYKVDTGEFDLEEIGIKQYG